MEIRFKRDTAFRKTFFVPESFAHPAKMDAQLLIWIVEHYTETGETILDPMAGSGTTMLACTLGRNCILVELEEKFCKMMRDNWEQVRMRPQLGSSMGSCEIVQGDARQLDGLQVDKCVFSPPFFNTSIKKKFKSEEEIIEFAKKTKLYKTGRSLEAIVKMIKKNWNADEGLVDKIVTSPPYAETVSKYAGGDTPERLRGFMGESCFNQNGGYGSEGNIGNLPYGEIDKCIFSPPYEAMVNGSGEGPLVTSKKNPGYKPMPNAYGQIDKIVTSPPYEGSINADTSGIDWTKGTRGRAENWKPRDRSKEPAFGKIAGFGIPLRYSDNQDNIGNLKSESYLEAMLRVYQQCYKVLRPQGLMILVTKNFIRNKQVVRLDEDTIKLCEQAGFSFVERHYRELPSQSFWRVIYHQKFPDVEQIKNEDVLVFQKC